MMRAVLLAFGVALAGAAHAAPASVVIGDLVLDYDDSDWRVEAGPDGARLLPLDCGAPWCKDGMGIAVVIAPADGAFPGDIPRSDYGYVQPLWDLLNDPPAWPGSGPIREINGFTVFATDRWSGCRAMSPSELTAILDHAGRRYTFASGIAAACGGVWGVGREALVGILVGLRPRT